MRNTEMMNIEKRKGKRKRGTALKEERNIKEEH
jgi:hypothetical protein